MDIFDKLILLSLWIAVVFQNGRMIDIMAEFRKNTDIWTDVPCKCRGWRNLETYGNVLSFTKNNHYILKGYEAKLERCPYCGKKIKRKKIPKPFEL